MKKRVWSGGGGLVEKVGVTIGVGQIRHVRKPAHSYGVASIDLRKDEERAKAEAAAAKAAEVEKAEEE